MKKQLFSFLILLILIFNISAQEKSPVLYSELPHISCDLLGVTLSNYLLELQNRPDTFGYIIFYDGKYTPLNSKNAKSKENYLFPAFGEINHRMNQLKNHFKAEEIKNEILLINGGFKDFYKVHFWIVPKGTKPPVPHPSLDKISYRKGKTFTNICINQF